MVEYLPSIWEVLSLILSAGGKKKIEEGRKEKRNMGVTERSIP